MVRCWQLAATCRPTVASAAAFHAAAAGLGNWHEALERTVLYQKRRSTRRCLTATHAKYDQAGEQKSRRLPQRNHGRTSWILAVIQATNGQDKSRSEVSNMQVEFFRRTGFIEAGETPAPQNLAFAVLLHQPFPDAELRHTVPNVRVVSIEKTLRWPHFSTLREIFPRCKSRRH